MARPSSEKKNVPQQFVSSRGSLTGDAHASGRRTEPEREKQKITRQIQLIKTNNL